MKPYLLKRLLTFLYCAGSLAVAQDAPAPTQWTNTSGASIQGDFVKIEGDSVVILKDGKEFSIPLGNLSPASRKQASECALSPVPANPSAYQYGLYIHFGIPTYGPGHLPADKFAPTDLDMPGWARVAKENGMTFAVLTAKHESGFCLWESAGYDYDVSSSPAKKDLVAEFVTACKTEGIVPGVHYSIPDAFNEGEVKFQGSVGQAYYSVIKKHLTELLTQHPDLQLVTLDRPGRLSSSQTAELSQLMKRLNPKCVVFGVDNYQGGFDGNVVYATILKNWFWSPGAPSSTADGLYKRYVALKPQNRPFLVNVSPNRQGRIPSDQQDVLKEFSAMKTGAGKRPVPAQAAKPAAERLKELRSLQEQGLISKEDYDNKLKEIMAGL